MHKIRTHNRKDKSGRLGSQASRKLVLPFLVMALVATFAGAGQAQTPSVTIFTSETTGNIYQINNTTGVSSELGTSGAFAGDSWNGAAYDPTTYVISVAGD